jgi:uncharacterized protein YxjI
MHFDKFAFKNTGWFKTGNFQIIDHNNVLAYRVKSNIWQFKKVFFLVSANNDPIYKIASKSSLNTSYLIYEKDTLVAEINKPFSWTNQMIEINTSITEPFIVKGNIWGNEYQFQRNDDDFAMVSYNLWSAGELGVAIKKGEIIPLVLAVVVIIAFLKQSGMA